MNPGYTPSEIRCAAMKRRLAVIAAGIGVLIAGARLIQPSNDRDWSVDQAILPYAEIDPPFVTIHKIRNFDYQAVDRYTPSYYDKTFDLRRLESVWFIVEPFGQP